MYTQLKQSLTNDTHYWVSGLLIISVLFIYGQTIRHDFIPYDDPHYIYDNQRVLEGLTWDNFKWSWTTFEFSNWHPLTWISMMTDVSLYGNNAGPHHITSAFIHLLNSFLVYIVLLKMTKAPWRSGFAAILFAIHPLHIESVAWASERKDVLAAFFGLLSIYFYTRFVQNKSRKEYAASFIAFSLGLCCKPMLVTWPFLFLLLDYWPLNRIDSFSIKQNAKLIIEKIPFAIFSIGVSILTYMAQDASGSIAAVQKFPIHIRFMNSIISYFEYILLTIFPSNLAVIYPHVIENISVGQFLISGVALAVLVGLSLLYIKKTPALFVGLGWFFGVLVPVIGLVQVGGAAMADRYTYLPHVGLFVAFIWGGYALIEYHNKIKPIVVVLCAAYCVGLVWAANQQTSHWRTGVTLFTHTLKVTPGNTKAYTALGLSYARNDKHKEALEWFQGAAQLDPGNVGAHQNEGTALLVLDRFEEAERSFKSALALNPEDPQSNFYLGLSYYHQQKFPEALASARKALTLKDSYKEAEVLIDEITRIIKKNAPEQL
jgi:hypothetical protein